jgi:hypothetical protein
VGSSWTTPAQLTLECTSSPRSRNHIPSSRMVDLVDKPWHARVSYRDERDPLGDEVSLTTSAGRCSQSAHGVAPMPW